jgi:hypothetical protein
LQENLCRREKKNQRRRVAIINITLGSGYVVTAEIPFDVWAEQRLGTYKLVRKGDVSVEKEG